MGTLQELINELTDHEERRVLLREGLDELPALTLPHARADSKANARAADDEEDEDEDEDDANDEDEDEDDDEDVFEDNTNGHVQLTWTRRGRTFIGPKLNASRPRCYGVSVEVWLHLDTDEQVTLTYSGGHVWVDGVEKRDGFGVQTGSDGAVMRGAWSNDALGGYEGMPGMAELRRPGHPHVRGTFEGWVPYGLGQIFAEGCARPDDEGFLELIDGDRAEHAFRGELIGELTCNHHCETAVERLPVEHLEAVDYALRTADEAAQKGRAARAAAEQGDAVLGEGEVVQGEGAGVQGEGTAAQGDAAHGEGAAAQCTRQTSETRKMRIALMNEVTRPSSSA